MAIDYVLGTGCDPQQQLGVDRMVALHRTRILARAALAHARRDEDESERGDPRGPDEIAVQLTTRMPDGHSTRDVRIQDLLDEVRPLDAVAPRCAACPVGLAPEFACHRRIRYPIPERVEEWLMARLPTTLACAAGALLARGLDEFRWDGAPVAKLRASGTTYFESRAPYGVRWQGEGRPIEVSSDQLFQMMFMVGNLAPTHCLMLALFCGVIPHDISLHDLKDRDGRARALDAARLPPEPDAAIEQFAAFLRTLALAARHDVPILVDG